MQTVSQAASAEYYLGHMESYRSPYHYYNAGDEPDGRWWNPSGLLGLSDGDDLLARDFQSLYAGLSPVDGAPLTRNANRKGRSPGIDITFSADKSVSALWAIAPEALREQIEACHHDAVRWTLDNVTRAHCAWTRRGAGGVEVVSGDIFGATFTHHTSRDGDPQLHTHCVILNLVRTHDDGAWRSLHQRPIYQWVRAGGAIYRHAMAWYLQDRIGLPVERYGRDQEFVRVAGMPEELLRAWSTRRGSIERLARRLGITTAETPTLSQAITLATRARKDAGDPSERDARFLAEAEQYVERDTLIAELLSASVTLPTQAQVREVLRRCSEIPSRLTRDEAVFTLPQILEHVARETAGVVRPDGVQMALNRTMRSASVLPLDGHRAVHAADARAGLAHTRLYSTIDYATEEHAVKSAAQRSITTHGYAIDRERIDRHLEALQAQGYPIGSQQRDAVHHLAGGDTSLAVCLGAAGSGKTVALRPVADLHRAQGHRVLAAALSWRAAVNLGTECGVQPYSLARLLRQVRAGTMVIDRNTVLLVDEAGMLSVREIRTVLELAERAGAKVLFIGDLDQLQPIEAGPGLRLLVDELGAARIHTIRRQRPDLEDLLVWERGLDAQTAAATAPLLAQPEREALLARRGAFRGQGWQAKASEAARKGDAGAVIDAYVTRDRLHFESNFDRTVSRLATDWLRHRHQHPEASRLVIARTNREVRVLSHVLRALAHPSGIPRPSVTVTTGRGEPGRRKTTDLEIAPGDLLRIGATLWEQQLFNGSFVTVDSVARVIERAQDRVRITATTEDKRQVRFYADQVRDIHGNIRLDYGYALTIASAQGSTADRVFLLADDRPSRETIYPALTRHRDRLDLYLDTAPLALAVRQYRSEEDWDKPVTRAELHAHLAYRWSRSAAKEAAYDYASPERRTEIESRIAEEAARRSARHLMRTLRPAVPDPSAEALPAGAEARVLARLTARGGAFSAEDVRRALWREDLGRDELEAATARVLSQPNVMPLYGHDARAERPAYTTTETYAAEEQLARLAAHLHTDVSHPASPSERVIASTLRRLPPETADTARTLLAPGRLNVVPLAADRTRSAALGACVRALTRHGVDVVACAPSRRSLRAYQGLVARPRTVHGLIAALSQGRAPLSRTALIVVNDAQDLDTDTLYTLARLADEARVRLLLIGDPRDRCRSPAFAWLATHCASDAPALRAPDHLPAPQRAALEGEPDIATLLAEPEAQGRLHRLQSDDALRASVVAAWMRIEASRPQDTQLAIAAGAAAAAELNAAIQIARAAAGSLGESRRFDVLRPAFTDPEAPRAASPSPTPAPETTERLTVHVGDRLRILENHPQSGLCRGDVGTVRSVSRRRIRLEVGGTVHAFNPVRHNRFALGYAASVYQHGDSVDHVHATLSSAWNRAALFRAAASHRQTLNVHWRAAPGQTLADLARAIDSHRATACTQFYTDRQRAILAAHDARAADTGLRRAWHLLSDSDRTRIDRQDREHRAAIHAHQRPRDSVPSWLRVARPTALGRVVRDAFRYRTEGAAALDYQSQFDELAHEITHLRGTAESDSERHADALQRLGHLTAEAERHAARSADFRAALRAKTRFTAEDLPRHRAACRHELRALELDRETRRIARHFTQRALAWALTAEAHLDQGAELSTRADLADTRPWFLDDYAAWRERLPELETEREALADARKRVAPSDLPAPELIEEFDAASRRLARFLDYDERERAAAERASDYVALRQAFALALDDYYRHEQDRTPPERSAAQHRLTQSERALAARATELAAEVDWLTPHLERHGLTASHVLARAKERDPHRASIARERTHRHDRDIEL